MKRSTKITMQKEHPKMRSFNFMQKFTNQESNTKTL